MADRLADEPGINEQLATKAERYFEALEYLSDPDNWQGDPASHDAVLLGHDTPFELACNALAEGHDGVG